jgi:hypothetical protein
VSGRAWLDALEALPDDRRAVVERMAGEICGAMSRDLAAFRAAGAAEPDVLGFHMDGAAGDPRHEAFRANLGAVVDRLIGEDLEAVSLAFEVLHALILECFDRYG